ncbi:MAG: Txe/YoeB family addiction module toxin [Elusimicrobiota bacterium]
MSWKVVLTKEAVKDYRKLEKSGFRDRVHELFNTLSKNPFKPTDSFEKLMGDLIGAYSRRINIQHRLVYYVLKKEHVVKIVSMWSHYE